MLFPEQGDDSGFDAVVVDFDASTEVHLRSSLSSLHDVIKVTPFNHDVHHRGFRPEQLPQFEASSHKAAPKDLPSSFVQYRRLPARS